jgi:ABC-type bacteriocin/lantibiotic exporter with double-glycine peptidase domain
MPAVVLFHVKYGRRIRKKSTVCQEALANVAGNIGDTINGIQIAKVTCSEKYLLNRAVRNLIRQMRINIDLAKTFQVGGIASSLSGAVGTLIVMYVGIRMVMTDALTLGTYIAFASFLQQLYGPTLSLMSINQSVQESLASLERIYEILDTKSEKNQSAEPSISIKRPVKGDIRFENIHFSYDSDSDFRLAELTLDVFAGEKVSIVGHSGSGKTTLLRLLLKLYEPDQGRITLDGQNIRHIDTKDLRRQFNVVTQDGYLFPGTIAENIRIGNSKASYEEIEHAAYIAKVLPVTERFQQGLQTQVGESGIMLSGGERQKIAIARALLRGGSILVLDEAASEVDYATEKTIYDAMMKEMPRCTCFHISHRLNNITCADKVVVVENGSIIACGKHHDIYDAVEEYRRYYENNIAVNYECTRI